jgi:hypothetical protein
MSQLSAGGGITNAHCILIWTHALWLDLAGQHVKDIMTVSCTLHYLNSDTPQFNWIVSTAKWKHPLQPPLARHCHGIYKKHCCSNISGNAACFCNPDTASLQRALGIQFHQSPSPTLSMLLLNVRHLQTNRIGVLKCSSRQQLIQPRANSKVSNTTCKPSNSWSKALYQSSCLKQTPNIAPLSVQQWLSELQHRGQA